MIFYTRMAWRSLRRTPGLNVVMIVALALGIGTWYAQRQVFVYLDAKTPVAPPDLYLVALDRDGAARAAAPPAMAELMPSILLTPRDAEHVLGAGIAARQTITFAAPGLVEPEGAAAETVRVRYATRDLFEMFDVPLVEGTAWPATADDGAPSDAVVVDEKLARRLYGGAPAIGRTLRVDGAELRIVGVAAANRTGRYVLFERFVPVRDSIFLPRAHAAPAHAVPDSRMIDAGGDTGSVMAWVELPTEAARTALVARATAYLASERARGRTTAPTTVTLLPAAAWRQMYIPRGTIRLWPLLSAMCLVACVINLVRMLMVKFDGRGHDLGLLRAFGARRRAVLGQLLIEAVLIGLIAGVCGLVVGLAMLPLAAGALPRSPGAAALIDAGGIAVTLLAAVAASAIAALYPAWRLASGTPARQLQGGR